MKQKEMDFLLSAIRMQARREAAAANNMADLAASGSRTRLQKTRGQRRLGGGLKYQANVDEKKESETDGEETCA